MNKTAICLIIVFLIVISIISYLLLSPCPDGKEKKGFQCVDKAASTTSSQRSNLFGNAAGCTSATPYRLVNSAGVLESCVAVCPPGRVINDLSQCIIPRSIIPPLTYAQRAAGITRATVTNVSQCPPDRFKEYGTCVPSCSLGMIRDISDCVATCPDNRPILDISFGLPVCVSTCPPGKFRDLSNGVTSVCRTSCPSIRPANGSVCQSCSSRTPSLLNSNGQCLQAGQACPAGTYRNDISMCVPINPLSAAVVTKTAISEGFFPNQRFVNIIDGSFNTLYNPMNTTSPTWVYFQNVTKSGQLLYGFTIKFGREGGEPNVNLKIYNNNTTLTDNNKIFDETFLNVGGSSGPGGDIASPVRRSFNPPINVTNLYLLFSRWIFIYEFEVTVL